MRRAVLLFVLAGALGLAGCTAGREAAVPERIQRPVRDTSRGTGDLALRHFIDGGIYEMKGEYAQAVLEYQDALRYDDNHAIHYALAKCYFALEKKSLAIESGREAVRRAPDNLEYRKLLASVYASAYELDSAIAQYEEVIARDRNDIESWYHLGRLYQGRKPLKALEVYETIVERFGPEWEILLQMADLYNKLGKFDRAAASLDQMLDIDPSNQELRRMLGQTYVRAAQYDSALSVFQQLRELDPDNVETLAEIAGVHLLRKEYTKAAVQFDAIMNQDSVSLEAKLRIGEMYFAQMEKDSSLAPLTQTIFERIRDKHPADWRAYWFLGAIGSVTDDDSMAVRNFRKVTELASWNTDAWVYLSGVFMGKENYGEMARILESALRVLPEDFRINFFLGVAYDRLGRDKEAVQTLEQARRLNPKDIDAITQLAIVYERTRNLEMSDSLYEEALQLDPKNDLVLNNYSYSLAERNIDLDRALEMAEKAVKAKPDNASYLDTMGWVLYRLGRYREAAEYVRKAIAQGNANAVLYEHLGDILYNLDDQQGAMEQWNMALRLDAGNQGLKGKITRGAP